MKKEEIKKIDINEELEKKEFKNSKTKSGFDIPVKKKSVEDELPNTKMPEGKRKINQENIFNKYMKLSKETDIKIVKSFRLKTSIDEIISTYCKLYNVSFSEIINTFLEDFIKNLPEEIIFEIEKYNKKRK